MYYFVFVCATNFALPDKKFAADRYIKKMKMAT